MESSQHSVIKNTILAAILVMAVAVFLYLSKFDGNITGFFRIGSTLPLSPYLNTQDVLVYKGQVGYDGQQFLSLALDPLLQNKGTIEALDNPRYRYRRILYPLLGHLLGFGNPHLIPYILVGINCLCIILLVFIIGLAMRRHNQMTWQSLMTLAIPGVWIVLSLSTTDLLSSSILAIAIYCYRTNKPIYTAIALSLACLTRETMLLLWLGFLLTSIWERQRTQTKHLFWAWIPAALWNIYVLYKLPSQGSTSGISENFGYPLVGIFNKLLSLMTGGLAGKNLFEAYLFILLIGIFAAIILIGRQGLKENQIILGITTCYSLIFIMSSMTILSYFLDYSRVFMDVYFLLLQTINFRSTYLKTLPLALAGLPSIIFLIAHS